MSLKVPNFAPIPGLTAFLNDVMRHVDAADRNKLESNKANNQLLLYSPNKSVYAITVTDAGVVTATKVG